MNKVLAGICGSIFIFCFSTAVLKEIEVSKDNPIISLDLHEVEIRKALEIIAKFAHFNMVVEHTIQGKVSLHLDSVPAEDALEALLQLKNLMQEQKGKMRVIRMRPPVPSDPISYQTPILESKHIRLKHREAKEIEALFLQSHAQSTPHSSLAVDVQTNSLWVRDTPSQIKALERLVHTLDHNTQQILIEARIVSMNRNLDHALGMCFHLKPLLRSTLKGEEHGSSEDSVLQADPLNFPLALDLPNARDVLNRVGPLLWSGFNKFLDIELAAMEQKGEGRIVSSPHLMTTQRNTALIEAGSEIPYQEKGRYGTSVAFKKAVLSLKVTPEIMNTKQILLKLEVHHDKPGVLTMDKTPSIDTQTLKTQVIIQSGETVALGGIYETVSQQNRYRVPGLSRLPVLGWLFRQQNQIHTTRELLVFVTPYLVSDTPTPNQKQVKS